MGLDILAAGLGAIVANIEAAHGDTTYVNGVSFPGALWAQAQASRLQVFAQEDFEGKPAYVVTFPVSVLGAPWNLKGGSAITRPALGWRGSVQMIGGDSLSDTEVVVRVLVLLSVGK